MGRETALAFFEKVRKDAALRNKLASMSRTDIVGLLRVAADAGYFFNARDYQAALEFDYEMNDELRCWIAQGNFIIPGINLSKPRGSARP